MTTEQQHFTEIAASASAIKVTLLGDSIRQIGYGKRVPELLAPDFSVWQPSENCMFSKYTLRWIYEWRQEMAGSRIVHWNNGLWDVDTRHGGSLTPLAEYVENMKRIADRLQREYGTVIFATTTPPTADNNHLPTELVMEYNAAVVPELERMGVAINDLFALVYPRREQLIRADDKTHLNEEGIEVCAAQVAQAIRRVAAGLTK